MFDRRNQNVLVLGCAIFTVAVATKMIMMFPKVKIKKA